MHGDHRCCSVDAWSNVGSGGVHLTHTSQMTTSLKLPPMWVSRWKKAHGIASHYVRSSSNPDSMTAFDAWRSTLWLRRRIEQRCQSCFNGRMLVASMFLWRMNRWWCDALMFNPRGARVVNPRVVNPNESPTLIFRGGTTGMMLVSDVFHHQCLHTRFLEQYRRHAVLNSDDAERH